MSKSNREQLWSIRGVRMGEDEDVSGWWDFEMGAWSQIRRAECSATRREADRVLRGMRLVWPTAGKNIRMVEKGRRS